MVSFVERMKALNRLRRVFRILIFNFFFHRIVLQLNKNNSRVINTLRLDGISWFMIMHLSSNNIEKNKLKKKSRNDIIAFHGKHC